MSPLFDCADEAQLLTGMRLARQAIAHGQLVVLPTDTVYGVAADAFDRDAVARLLAAKGRGRQKPPPVQVSGIPAMRALVETVPEEVERLVDRFWPGGLTVILPAQPSLSWDLGDTEGTVAIRMPDHRIALELLEETGPLAVSSANTSGAAAALSALDARDMLGDDVAVYLDDGFSRDGIASTIIDATALVTAEGDERRVRILRSGGVTREQLADALGDALEPAPDVPDIDPHAHVPPQPEPDPRGAFQAALRRSADDAPHDDSPRDAARPETTQGSP